MSSFRDNDLSWAEKITQMLDELCELLSNCTYDRECKLDIIKKETKIYEWTNEYVPRLLPDLDEFYEYIHEAFRYNTPMTETEIEGYIILINRHLYRRNDYTQYYLDYSDERSKYEPEIASSLKSQMHATEREYLYRMINSDQRESQEEPETKTRITKEERIALAQEHKQNVINAIIEDLSKQNYPVPINWIHHNIPGATRQIIELVRKESKIIDYKDRLSLGSKLRITWEQKNLIKNAILNTYTTEKAHTSEEIYRQLNKDRNIRNLLPLLHIYNSFGFFSVIRYLFPKDFIYSRPQVALPGQKIARPLESITQYIYTHNKVNIKELRDFIDYSGYDLSLTLSLINKLPDIILADRNTLIPKRYLTLTNEQLKQITHLINNELRNSPDEPDTLAIRDLTCAPDFPILNPPLNEWLIYSILTKWNWNEKKYKQALYVYTTSPYLSRAIPIVSIHSSIDKQTRIEIAAEHAGTLNNQVNMAADDLSNLDELIEDEIEYDWDLEALEEEDEEI